MIKTVSILLLALFSFSCSSHQQKSDDVLTLKKEAKLQMEAKVNKVISQLKSDCDSTLMRMARQQVDSIKQARLAKLKKAKSQKRHQDK